MNDIKLVPQQFGDVICLCGSSRFLEEFNTANRQLSVQGWIVLTICIQTSEATGDILNTPFNKKNLDALHFKKIDLADAVLVLNAGGYIGESTQNEIDYANTNNKQVFYLESLLSAEEINDMRLLG